MAPMRPRVGLTASVAPTSLGVRRTFLNEPYLVAIREAGGLPVLVTPVHAGATLRELYDWLDGIVLTGGEDVEPTRYGAGPVHPSVRTLPERDAMEFALLEWALADGLPLLAICRGLQVLNVALGGTLYQDLPTERPGPVTHDQATARPPVPRPEPSHGVSVVAGSRLGALIGAGPHRVNSLHHQGLQTLGHGLRAVGHAEDGLVEAVETVDPTHPFLVGVQWHPEELVRASDAASCRLFEAFVAAAAMVRRA